jgi:hypothetical protein
MKDKTLKILLGIIALNLTALKDVELIPTAYAQSGGVQKIAICNETGQTCANIMRNGLRVLAEER